MMESYKVMEILIGRDTDKIAKHLGLKDRSLLARHKLPFPGATVLGTDNTKQCSTGARNDLERLAKEMLYVQNDLEAGPERYAAPLFWLGRLFKYVCIPMPEKAPTINNLHESLTRLMKEVGDVAAAHTQALDNNVMEVSEAERISKEIYQVMQQALGYNMAVCHAAGIPVPGEQI